MLRLMHRYSVMTVTSFTPTQQMQRLTQKALEEEEAQLALDRARAFVEDLEQRMQALPASSEDATKELTE
ncbi:MAG TPA: hypothetical protein VE219_04205 [Candidatus Sulfotelmatobacter sp.]|nr:hypothetical protein [Candidatus Sulfotelmatobacter sp.]